jgi:hypothetical protein
MAKKSILRGMAKKQSSRVKTGNKKGNKPSLRHRKVPPKPRTQYERDVAGHTGLIPPDKNHYRRNG